MLQFILGVWYVTMRYTITSDYYMSWKCLNIAEISSVILALILALLPGQYAILDGWRMGGSTASSRTMSHLL